MQLTELIYKLRVISRNTKILLNRSIGILFFVSSLTALLMMIYEFGFTITPEHERYVSNSYQLILRIFLWGNVLRLIINPANVWKEKGFWIELIVIAALMLVVFTGESSGYTDHVFLQRINHVLTYVLLILISLIQFSKDVVTTLQRHLKPEMMFAYSFLFIILAGAFLLMLPNAHHGHLGFINALFTSTSAVCVTGLTVTDTATTFTPIGQTIILILIQIGGIGVMTFTSFFAMSFFSQTAFQDQMVMKNLLNEDSLNNIFQTLVYILLTTILIEAIGAYIIYWQIADIPASSIPDKYFFALFHAISAFCNAGFSTLPGNLYDPAVRHLYSLQGSLAMLIVLGGIGFPIVFNYGKLFRHTLTNTFRRLIGKPGLYTQARIVSTTTRIVISTTLCLLIIGTALFWLFENDNTLKGLPFAGKLATSFMGAVTPRTAGFNSVEVSTMLPTTIFLTMILMWIGASPMSTGGGIKTTTFVIALKNIYATIKGKERVETTMRQLTVQNVNRANTIIMLSLLWIALATMLLLITNPHAGITRAIFEVVSAIGTVGLTLDLTPTLNDTGKIIICITMFVGRVGLITLLSGIVKQQAYQNYTYADENIIL